MQNLLRSDSCIFAPDADSCELRVSMHPANAIRGTLFQSVSPGSIPSSRCWIVRRGDKQIQIRKGLPQSLKGYDRTGKTADSCRGKTAQSPQQGKGGYGIMKLSRYEQETVINYNAGEQTATLYTRDKAAMRKLDTLVADFPDTYKLAGQDEVSKTYSFPKSHVSYRKPRVVSTEQRERARQMMIAKNKEKEN